MELTFELRPLGVTLLLWCVSPTPSRTPLNLPLTWTALPVAGSIQAPAILLPTCRPEAVAIIAAFVIVVKHTQRHIYRFSHFQVDSSMALSILASPLLNAAEETESQNGSLCPGSHGW